MIPTVLQLLVYLGGKVDHPTQQGGSQVGNEQIPDVICQPNILQICLGKVNHG